MAAIGLRLGESKNESVWRSACKKMERRLGAAIEKEWAKTDSPADMRFISACQDLLWELQTGGRIPYVSNMEACKTAFMSKLSKYQKRRSMIRLTARLCTTVFAIVILAVVGDGILNRGWLHSHSTDDGQQYVIQGQAVDTSFVSKGAAAVENDPAPRALYQIER